MRRLSLAVALASLAACSGDSKIATSWWKAKAIDGDTFVARGTHYRLAWIDAPEMPGHCRGYRAAHNLCAPGNPYAAKIQLQRFLDNLNTFCTPIGLDYYKRTLVECTYRNTDVGEQMIALGYAVPYERKQA
jgi:micrococcal nuclease